MRKEVDMAIYDKTSLKADEFINHEEILKTIEYANANKNNIPLIDSILEKAKPVKSKEMCIRDRHICYGRSNDSGSTNWIVDCRIFSKVLS